MAQLMLKTMGVTGKVVMDETATSNERMPMTAVPATPVVPDHPNIVETVTLLEDPGLQAKERTALKRVLHDTVRLVRKKRDGKVYVLPVDTV